MSDKQKETALTSDNEMSDVNAHVKYLIVAVQTGVEATPAR